MEIALILFLLICGGSLWYLKYTLDAKKALDKALSLVFLKVTIPKKESDLDEKKETGAGTFKEVVSVMEQLLASLHDIGDGSYLSLEYAVLNSKVYFYMVVPYDMQDIIEKQITSYYPDAIVDVENDYNIFGKVAETEAVTMELKKSYEYPIKTYQQLEADPLNNLTNSLSKLTPEEGALIQIMIRPEKSDAWSKQTQKTAERLYQGKKETSFGINPFDILKDVFKVFTTSAEEEKKPEEPKQVTPVMQEVIKAIETKSHKIGFEVLMRIVTSAPTKQQAKTTMQSIIASLVQFRHTHMNAFTKVQYMSTRKTLSLALFRIFQKTHFWQKPMYLGTEEIASLYHFPHHRFNKSDALKWQTFKIAPPPENLPDEGLLLGHTNFRGVKKEVRIKNEDRFRHFYIIGQTGTGKSTILQTMIKQDLRNGAGLCVMDPHGDLAKEVMPFIPRERADDVIIFSPADLERPLGLNMLEAETDEEMELVAMDAMNIMIKMFGNEIFGPRIQDYFRNGVLTLMSDPEGGTLIDIVNLFVNEEFQKKKRSHLRNAIVRNWWDHTFDSMGDREKQEMIPYFAAKFGQFITNGTMRNILGQTKSAFDLSKVMQEGKILLMDLSKGLVGDLNSNLLGMIIVSKIQVAAMRRQKIPKAERRDFFLYIDEFQNYVTDSIESILSEARKYRLGLILGHQYIDQLEKKDLGGTVQLKGAIFGNVGNVLSYKIGEIDAEFMAKVFAPVFSEQDIANQDAFKAIMKLSIDLQPSRPFSLTVQKAWEMEGYTADEQAAEAYKQLSRLKYGRQREFIDQEIRYRIGAV